MGPLNAAVKKKRDFKMLFLVFFLLWELGLNYTPSVQLKLISFNYRYDSHPAFNGGLRAHNMKGLSVIPEFASLLNEL